MNMTIIDDQACKQIPNHVRALRQLLIGSDASVFRAHWPKQPSGSEVSLKDSLETFGLKEEWRQIDDALARIESTMELASCPILGVAGMLNSGKTSIVASFLSREGRKRVLRGIAPKCGTQRFVFWLPEVWRENEQLWDALLGEIQHLFGGRLDFLKVDPEEAHKQYNQTSGETDLLGVPLVATDPNLSKLAILDCPDVQRPDTHSTKEHTAETRKEFLKQAAPICSAFLFVAREDNVQDADAVSVAEDLCSIMPGVPLQLLVNMAEPDRAPHKIYGDVRPVLETLEQTNCFVAYNYRYPDWEKVTPTALHGLVKSSEDKNDSVPACFQVTENPDGNPPNPVSEDRFLNNFVSQLDAAGLGRSQIKAHWDRFSSCKKEYFQKLQEQVQEDEQMVRAAHTCLLELCREQTQDKKGNPRIPLSPDIVGIIQQSMEDNAPRMIRPLLWSGRKIREAIVAGRKNIVEHFRKQDKIDQQRLDELRNVAMQANVLAFKMRQSNFPDDLRGSAEELEQAWEQVLKRTTHSVENLADSLDRVKINSATEEAWKKIPASRKITAGALALSFVTLPLVAVALIPFDLGTSTTAVTTTYLGQASLAELLAAAGLGTVSSVGAAATSLASALEDEVFVPYLSSFFAFACDAFGIPRTIDNKPPTIKLAFGHHVTLRNCTENIDPPPPWIRQLRWWEPQKSGRNRIENAIEACGQQIEICAGRPGVA